MNCHEFQDWLVNQDIYDARMRATAHDHLHSCEACRAVVALDERLEHEIKSALQTVDAPPHLWARIERAIRAATPVPERRQRLWLKWVPALAMAFVLAVVLIHHVSDRPSAQERLSRILLAEHLNSNLTMMFESTQAEKVARWFAQRLDFAVQLPDIHKLGLTLLGGRECRLGQSKAALVFCRKDGQKASLFILDPRSMPVDLADAQPHILRAREHAVQIWRDGTNLYAMVI